MSEQDAKKSGGLSRRDFLKLMGAAGTGLAFAPFVPWGNFMPNPSTSSLEKVPVILPDGTHANLKTFPTNHAEIITYPETGDDVLDEEAFRKWQFIRLPVELGGDKQDISAFRAYSMICLHLWCLWKYWPEEGRTRLAVYPKLPPITITKRGIHPWSGRTSNAGLPQFLLPTWPATAGSWRLMRKRPPARYTYTVRS